MPCNCVRSPSLRSKSRSAKHRPLTLLFLMSPKSWAATPVLVWLSQWARRLGRLPGQLAAVSAPPLRQLTRRAAPQQESLCAQARHLAASAPAFLALPAPSRAPGPPQQQSGLFCNGRSCCSSCFCTHAVTPKVLTPMNKAQSKDRCQLSVTAVSREPHGKLDICTESH